MNITAIRLVFVGTKSGLVVMCKILTVVVAFFIYACALIPLSLAATRYRSSSLLCITNKKIAWHKSVPISKPYTVWRKILTVENIDELGLGKF